MTDTTTLLTGQQPNPDAGGEPTAAAAPAQPAAQPTPEAAPATPPQAEDYSFAAPEGKTLDTEALQQFTDLAREAKLPKEQAQKVVDLGVAMADKWVAKQQAQLAEQVNGWVKDAQADPEIGNGNPQDLLKNLAVAKAGLDAWGSPELKDLLAMSGLGNHPTVIKHFLALGKQAQSDSTFVGGKPPAAGKTAAQVLYGTTN
jgi:hypothetical protein